MGFVPMKPEEVVGDTDLDVSVVVVSYNTRELTLACIQSLILDTRTSRYEVIVVDNASIDGSAGAIKKAFPGIKLIESNVNLGFAQANNLASEIASGRYMLLLNPDTVCSGNVVDTLVAKADLLGQRRILGGRTIYPDGRLNPTSCWGMPTLWSTLCISLGLGVLGRFINLFDTETMRGWLRDTEREVDIISGCLLMISVSDWRELGGFDESFVLYGEDFDLCLRARAKGFRCNFVPDAQIIHYGSASEAVKPDQLIRQMRARVQLIRKHWSPCKAVVGAWLIKFRVLIRAILPQALSKKQGVNTNPWHEVWRRRGEWLHP